MLRDLDLLTLVSGHTWRVKWSTPPPSLKILPLSVLELWVLTSTILYNWQERAGHLEARFQAEGFIPLPIYWYHSKGNWLRYNFTADSFYIRKLCSRLFVLYCRSRPKDDKSRHFDPHFEEVRGGVEPWWMCRVLVKHNWTFFYLLRLRRYKAKCVKTRFLQEWVGHLEPKFQGEGVVPGEYFLVSTKLDTFCYPTVETAPCYVPSFWHNTGMWRTDGRTDGRTDRMAVANTALAMRALHAL